MRVSPWRADGGRIECLYSWRRPGGHTMSRLFGEMRQDGIVVSEIEAAMQWAGTAPIRYVGRGRPEIKRLIGPATHGSPDLMAWLVDRLPGGLWRLLTALRAR